MSESDVEFTGITPCLRYEDAGAMLEPLARVFGFEERARFVDRDGVVRQAEMYVGANELFLAGHGPGHREKLGRHPDFLRCLSRGYVQTKPLEEGGWREILAPGARR